MEANHMFASVSHSVGQRTTLSPQRVEEFENMMKNFVKQGREWEQAKAAKQGKKAIIYKPAENPFAPLYKPDQEVLVKVDKYHIPPARYIPEPVKEEPKQLLVAAAGGSVPPPGDGKNPDIYKDLSKLEKLAASDNLASINNNSFEKNLNTNFKK